jgi:large subunit ribosomal protein L18
MAGSTLCAASTVEKGFEGNGGNCEAAKKVGQAIAERAKAKGIENVVFRPRRLHVPRPCAGSG